MIVTLVADLRLNSINLQEFRGVKRVEGPPIKLAKFNVLIGKNNSGKTSLLEAIALLPQPSSVWPFSDSTRVQAIASCHGKLGDSLVYGYSGTAVVTYGVGSNMIGMRLETNGHFQFETRSPEEMPQNIVYSPGSDGIYRMDRATKSLSQVNAVYYSDDFYDILRTSMVGEANWKSIEKTRAHNRVLKEVINPSITEKFTEVVPHYVGQQPVLQVRKEFPDGTSSYVRITELGRGIQRVIVPLLLFEATNPSVGLWDDVEAGMHPSLVEHVLEWLFKKDWQMIISTHSIDILSTIAELEPKDAQLILLDKSADDLLTYKIVSSDEFSKLVGSGQDPRRMVDLFGLREQNCS
jgi:energy-coupling factor transporter ATP-binding protein EcfA2